MKHSTLKKIFANLNASTMIGVDTETEPTLKGKDNELKGRVKKRKIGNVALVFTNENGNSYEKVINKKMKDMGLTGEFKVGERKWGSRIEGTPLIEHNDELYVEMMIIKEGRSTFYVDGRETNPSAIEGLRRDREETLCMLRCYKASSILEIRMNGRIYA